MTPPTSHSWLTRGMLGIVLATFFSDVGHEMVTATLPMYLGAIGLGAFLLPAAFGLAGAIWMAWFRERASRVAT